MFSFFSKCARLLFAALLLCSASAFATSLKISANSTVRSASEVEANYTTTHLFVNEIAGDSIPITIFFDPQATNIATCEVFTNLNRRDRAQLDADGDGVEDGIKPPNGNNIVAGDDSNYYKAYTMSLVTGGYQITLNATRTGAYRLTARYRFNGEPAGTWHYYGDDGGHRDHALVVSPKLARDLTIYECNPLTIDAEGTLPSQRSTFSDLANGLGAGHAPRFNLDYVKSLGANTLWFQPIHPNGIAGRQTDPDTGQPFEVGSPYAVKNFFDVMPLMARGFTPPANATPSQNDTAAGRAAAMTEFQNFVGAADAAGVNVMLDAPFNHTAYDAELAALGQTFFGNAGTNAGAEIRNTEARFFSRTDNYDMRAYDAGSIAVAPDRYDFGKFADTYDVYYGRYAALVRDAAHSNDYKNEGDWFDYSVGDENSSGGGNGHFDALTQNVWRYFADYTLYWLDQTGYPANPTGASLDSNAGIDCLRADFGQGLPPQCWEYIINKTRTRKWNFVFMAESLDGGEVTYRSARHFDILNENIVFPLHAATNTQAFRDIYDARRNAYGQGLVLLNTSSHDEDHYKDPFEAVIRFAANSTIDGAPLIFPGQELGLSGTVVPPNDSNSAYTAFGYDRYEVNFGKPIPHFKKFNSLMPLWLKTTPGDPSYNFGLAQLSKVYAAIGQARRFSPALRSSNRYYLNLSDGTANGQIFSVAKFENRNASPAASDVVFAFVNLDRNATPGTVGFNKFKVNVDADGDGSNDFGIKRGRQYNFKNIAAYIGLYAPSPTATRRDVFLSPTSVSGDDLLDNGVYVAMNKVPTTDADWGTATDEGHPYEAQYLKLYDVTPPPAAGAPSTPKAYAIGNIATFSWSAASDPDGGISGYHVIISDQPNGGGTVLFDGIVTGTTKTQTGGYDQTLYAKVASVNNAGIESATSTTSASGTILLNPQGDKDGDGVSNADEDAAGTNPLDSADVFRIRSIASATPGAVDITWSSVPGKKYQVEASADLAAGFTPLSGVLTAATGETTKTYHDTAASGARKFYRVKIVP